MQPLRDSKPHQRLSDRSFWRAEGKRSNSNRAMSDLFELRVSVLGVSKTVRISPDATVDELTAAVRKIFALGMSAGVSLSGGLPPQPLPAEGIIREVTTDKSLLRAIVKQQEPVATKATASKSRTSKKPSSPKSTSSKKAASPKAPREKASTSTKKEAEVNETKPTKRSRRAFDLSQALQSKNSRDALFLRAAMRSEMLSRLDQRKAEDRFAASLSKQYEIRESKHKLSGDVAEIEVSFAVDGSLGRKSKRRHVDVVEALSAEELVGAIRQVLVDPEDRPMLEPPMMARCSPRVFWALVRHSNGADVQQALELLLPDVDWTGRRPAQQAPQPPPQPAPQPAPQLTAASDSTTSQREMRARAAELRASQTGRDFVDEALLDCVGRNEDVLELLARANITAPRDLALWVPCPDLLAEAIGDGAPPLDSLHTWALHAEKMIADRPELKEYFAAPLMQSAD